MFKLVTGRVLIVAPDADLRRSLHFALEADGHSVTSRPQIDNRAPFSNGFDCAVLDHQAAKGTRDAILSFCELYHPVILLVSSGGHELSPRVFETLLKPMLGPALSQAVRRAVALGSNPT